MHKTYLPHDPHQLLLLPPALQDWLPADQLVPRLVGHVLFHSTVPEDPLWWLLRQVLRMSGGLSTFCPFAAKHLTCVSADVTNPAQGQRGSGETGRRARPKTIHPATEHRRLAVFSKRYVIDMLYRMEWKGIALNRGGQTNWSTAGVRLPDGPHG